MKYRKKPVEIEAIQLTKDNTCEVLTFCNSHNDIVASNDNGTVSIKTLEGIMIANIGDYVIRGVKGEYYPCKPDIFEATYDKVEEGVAQERFLPDFEVTLVPEEIANIASLLDSDPRMKKVEFDSAACSLHFVIQYSGNAIIKGIKEAAFTIYEGTTIIREDGIYRTEHRNEQ